MFYVVSFIYAFLFLYMAYRLADMHDRMERLERDCASMAAKSNEKFRQAEAARLDLKQSIVQGVWPVIGPREPRPSKSLEPKADECVGNT